MRSDIVPGASFPDYELPDLTRAIRPDWDLSKPELKRRWQSGDKAAFYPYGSKSMERVMLEMAGAVDQYTAQAIHTDRVHH